MGQSSRNARPAAQRLNSGAATGLTVCITANGNALELVRPGVLDALNELEANFAVFQQQNGYSNGKKLCALCGE